jgi:hypothetical protein
MPALVGVEPAPDTALEPVLGSGDPVERVAYAAEVLARMVLAHQSAVRALMSATITRADTPAKRPGYRFRLIDHALAPLTRATSGMGAATLAQLKLDLAVIISAEAVFTLTDMCGLSPEEAVASVVHTARVVTEAATRPD